MSDTRTALVTGGSRGIGEACARRLAADGFQVLLTYVSRPDAAEAVARDITDQGGSARAEKLDVGDMADISRFFAERIKNRVELHVLVNNAGVTRDGLMVRMKPEDWRRVLEVNLDGAFACMQEAAKLMMKRRAGRIVNMASVVGQMGNAGQANYVASKAGLIGLTKTGARELASRGVTVNAVAPGYIATDMTAELSEEIKETMLAHIPAGRLGQPEDIAAAVSYLASDASSYVTGQVLAVNGGMYM
jgi:3-oxoacyl-[acyl-carrier protein] reductase